MSAPATSREGHDEAVNPSRTGNLDALSEALWGVALRSEASKRASSARGPSAKRLAVNLRRDIVRNNLVSEHMQALSVTLTLRDGGHSGADAAMRSYGNVVTRRLRSGGALLALDCSATGRWHLHTLVIAPKTFDANKLIRWWLRLQPKGHRPVLAAQYVRPLKGGRHVELDRVLTHHLNRRREGQLEQALPRLADRAVACGALIEPWARVSSSLGLPGAPKPSKPQQADKAAAHPSRQRRLTVAPGHCQWCGRTLRTGGRRDARFHPSCGSSASRALCILTRQHGDQVRSTVSFLETRGWLRRDALRGANLAALSRVSLPVATTRDREFERLWLKRAWQCRCGSRLADRLNAKTCGSSRCRMKRKRARDYISQNRTKGHTR